MIINFIKKKVEAARRKKYLIKSAIERKKTNFVFRYLLLNYEKQTEGQVDIPAFMYAEKDMQEIKKLNKLNEAYILVPANVIGLAFILYGQIKYNQGIF